MNGKHARKLFLLPILISLWVQSAAAHDSLTERYRRAVDLYSAGQYEDSIKGLLTAYAIRPLPRLLLNIGQAYRKLGRGREALAYYEFYLRVETAPKPEIRAELEGYIVQAKAMIETAERVKQDLKTQEDEARDPAAPLALALSSPATVTPLPVHAAAAPAAHAAGSAGAPAAFPAPLVLPGTGATLDVTSSHSASSLLAGPLPSSREGLVQKPPSRPVYKRWWFWSGLGVLAAGAATGIVLGTQGGTTMSSLPANVIVHTPMFSK